MAPSGRKGVGRACEYATRTPGKTGTRGIAYPSTFLRWIRFSIEVFGIRLFRELVRRANAGEAVGIGYKGFVEYVHDAPFDELRQRKWSQSDVSDALQLAHQVTEANGRQEVRRGIYWMLSLARELVPPNTRDPAAILAHMSPRMDATVRAVTSVTDEVRCDDLADRDPLPHWGEGVVTLLGDAAHPLLPHTGQGAAQAIVDAVALGQALGDGANVADALRSYERERRPKTAVLVAQGRRTARIMRTTDPIACGLREMAIRLAPVKLFVKLYARLNRRAGTDVTRQAV